MINCIKCEFLIREDMKYSLMKNACPACGGSLFEDADIDVIKSVNYFLKKQLFTKSMSNVLINDISLFIFLNYISPKDSDSNSEHNEEEDATDVMMEDDNQEEGDIVMETVEEYSEEEMDIDEIRRQVSMEYESDESSNMDIFEEGDEGKVDRLRKLAKSGNMGKKQGAKVRRV